MTIALSGQYVMSRFTTVLKLFIYLMTFGVMVYSRHYTTSREIMRGEFHVLTLLSMLGAMVLVSANSLLTLYLGLELLSLPLYALVAMQRDRTICAEAAIKYFVMGALASGMLLYGMSLIYGLSDSLLLPQIVGHAANFAHDPVLLVAMVLVVAASAFKLGAVPFHMWVPDVYQGSPSSVTAFLGTVPKLAAFALLLRLLAGALPVLHVEWHQVLIVLAILSLLIGNVLAIVQTNIKRLFGYSTISHIGFILLAVAMGDASGYRAGLFYVIAYTLTALGGFGVVILLSQKRFNADSIEDYVGLSSRAPWVALMMMFFLLSMAGIPPFLGFDAKLLVILQLIRHANYGLATFVLVMSVVGAYYYLRIIKLMYFDEPIKEAPVLLSVDHQCLLTINGWAMLVLGILPAGLLMLCHVAF